MKYYLKLLSIPLFFLVLYTSLFLIYEVIDLPPVEELTAQAEMWFSKYGAPALFLSSIVEGILIVGGYFPGVFVIFVGVILSTSFLQALAMIGVATFGLIIAHSANYFMGEYGWYRLFIKFGMGGAVEQAKKRLEERGAAAIFLSYWLPSLGALTDTAAGIIQMPFKKFFTYSVFSSVFWYLLIGISVYFIGESALSTAAGKTGIIMVYSVIFFWIVAILVIDRIERKALDKDAL